ncbi:hypothetical protein [uncultured Microbulbifer sp.]|uniref:hypothetical protein n=1 Tax=uncultured Microbulbifer sp. TaxID=348147 RepID=UPI00262FB2B2|nr:hypothetical protein [uncultured Microbulbifer sp.]
MRFVSARQAWHDAFDGSAAAFDYEAMGNRSTITSKARRGRKLIIRGDVQGEANQVICCIDAPRVKGVETNVGKGSGSRVMDSCEKGIIQSVVAKLRQSDPLAYCWGMAAYAPPAKRFKERAALLQYLMSEFDKWEEPHPREKVGQLALFCITASALRDVNGRPIDLGHARTILGCDKKRWDGEWVKIWKRLQRRLDPLPARALGPVSHVVQEYRGRLNAAC